jgi:hypothetical protein
MHRFFSVVTRRPLWGCTTESGARFFDMLSVRVCLAVCVTVCLRRGTGALAFKGPDFQSSLFRLAVDFAFHDDYEVDYALFDFDFDLDVHVHFDLWV